MSKITRANIAAARAQRDILVRRRQAVPERIRKLAELDPDRLPGTQAPTQQESQQESQTSPNPLYMHGSIGLAGSWLRNVLKDQLWSESLSGTVVVPAKTNSTLVPVSDLPVLRLCLIDDPANTRGGIFMVDEDNVGRAEHIIHEEGGLGSWSPTQPPHH